MHSVSHLLNDWGLEFKHTGGKFVFQEKNAKRRKPRKKGTERGMQDVGGGSGLDPLFPPKIECN